MYNVYYFRKIKLPGIVYVFRGENFNKCACFVLRNYVTCLFRVNWIPGDKMVVRYQES